MLKSSLYIREGLGHQPVMPESVDKIWGAHDQVSRWNYLRQERAATYTWKMDHSERFSVAHKSFANQYISFFSAFQTAEYITKQISMHWRNVSFFLTRFSKFREICRSLALNPDAADADRHIYHFRAVVLLKSSLPLMESGSWYFWDILQQFVIL